MPKDREKLYHSVEFPKDGKFKYLQRQKMIKNCPVIDEDVKISEQICGSYMVSPKGKIIRHIPKTVQNCNIERPLEIREIHTDIIIFFILCM